MNFGLPLPGIFNLRLAGLPRNTVQCTTLRNSIVKHYLDIAAYSKDNLVYAIKPFDICNVLLSNDYLSLLSKAITRVKEV